MGLDTSPPPPRYLTELYESPEVAEPCEYMTPVVSLIDLTKHTNLVENLFVQTLKFDTFFTL